MMRLITLVYQAKMQYMFANGFAWIDLLNHPTEWWVSTFFLILHMFNEIVTQCKFLSYFYLGLPDYSSYNSSMDVSSVLL